MYFIPLGSFPFFHNDGVQRTWHLWAERDSLGELFAIRIAYGTDRRMSERYTRSSCQTTLTRAAWHLARQRLRERDDADRPLVETATVIPFRSRHS